MRDALGGRVRPEGDAAAFGSWRSTAQLHPAKPRADWSTAFITAGASIRW